MLFSFRNLFLQKSLFYETMIWADFQIPIFITPTRKKYKSISNYCVLCVASHEWSLNICPRHGPTIARNRPPASYSKDATIQSSWHHPSNPAI